MASDEDQSVCIPITAYQPEQTRIDLQPRDDLYMKGSAAVLPFFVPRSQPSSFLLLDASHVNAPYTPQHHRLFYHSSPAGELEKGCYARRFYDSSF